MTGFVVNGTSVDFSVKDSDLPHGLGGPPVALPSSVTAAIDGLLVSGSNTFTVDTTNVFGGPTGLYLLPPSPPFPSRLPWLCWASVSLVF